MAALPTARSLAFVAVLGVCACGEEGAERTKHEVVPITLEQMLRTYALNPTRADSEYKGRKFEFRARVEAVGKDPHGRTRLEFQSPAERGGAECTASGDDARLASVEADSTVKVRGRVVGIRTGISAVVLTECELVP